MVKHSRSSGSSWTKSVWSPICRPLLGKTDRGGSIGPWMGKGTELGMSICSTKTWIFLIGIRGWCLNGWKQAEHGSLVEEIDETCWSWRANFISWSHIFGMHSTWMQTEWNHDWGIYKNVWITYFCCSIWKITRWEKPYAKTVAWSYDMEGHAQKCVERYCELTKRQSSYTKSQVLAWMIIMSRRNLNQLENCQTYAHKVS